MNKYRRSTADNRTAACAAVSPWLAAAAVVALMGAGRVDATIISGSITGGTPGVTFAKINPASGFAVGNNDVNLPNVFGFDEKQNFVLTAKLATDIGLTSIPIGTIVSSHFIFFDPAKQSSASAEITFDAPILAVITTQRRLVASNYLGLSQVTYHDPALVGLEKTDSVDINNLFKPILGLVASSPGEHIRVITGASARAVPEPMAWTMAIGGFLLIGGAVRRSRRRPENAAAAAIGARN